MGARRLPLASVFVFGFCLTTGCGLSRGTPARSFQHTIPSDQTVLAEIGVREPKASSEGARAVGFRARGFTDRTNSTTTTGSSSDAGSRKEAARAQTANHLTTDEKRSALKCFEKESAAFQQAPKSQADDRWLDLFAHGLEKALELPLQRRWIEFSKAVIEHPRVRYFIGCFQKPKRAFHNGANSLGPIFPDDCKIAARSGAAPKNSVIWY